MQRNRVYQFLAAFDDKYDVIKREIVNINPLPSVREAYGIARREAMNEQVRKPAVAKARGFLNSGYGIASGLATINHGDQAANRHTESSPKSPANRRIEEDKSKLVCDHCKGRKHTRDTCFLLHGYPEWWEDMKKARQQKAAVHRGGGGRVSVAVGNRRVTLVIYPETPTEEWRRRR